MTNNPVSLSWSSQLSVAFQAGSSKSLQGDKITLPPSALEALLSAATTTKQVEASHPHTTSFDPFNPYSYEAERRARSLAIETQQQLPHPLTFRLVNPTNNRVVYAGIREFSADEGEVGLSPFLRTALGIPIAKPKDTVNGHTSDRGSGDIEEPVSEDVIDLTGDDDQAPRITVTAKQLPLGTYVKLRPLEAGYDIDDWRPLLEEHLRSNFTTLTNGEILNVPGWQITGTREQFRFLIDEIAPIGEAICVIDTNLNLDIEPLNEEQARETQKRRLAKAKNSSEAGNGSAIGGKIDVDASYRGSLCDGDYVDYELANWDRSQQLEIELTVAEESDELYLLVSPFSSKQRARPRIDEHVFGDLSSKITKRMRIGPNNFELENAESLYISVHAYDISANVEDNSLRHFQLRVTTADPQSEIIDLTEDAEKDFPPQAGEIRCQNCHQWVPQQRMLLHENFCLRNNVHCAQCNEVFQKRSEAWKNHWHCLHDSHHGNNATSKTKHDALFHTPHSCSNCPYDAQSVVELASHRTSLCPGKIILCQFCHLLVPQEGDPYTPSADAVLSGLSPHELQDGSRTTECHLCNKIIKLRDMSTHLRHHEIERLNRPKPRICRNQLCGRTLDGVGKNGEIGSGSRMGQGPGNDLGLCSICFGPLYVAMFDPEGKALKRRVERRYISQLISGCGKTWCRNEMCKTGRTNIGASDGSVMTTAAAIPLIKPLLDRLKDWNTPLQFCVNETSQRRRALAEMVAAEEGRSSEDGLGKSEANFSRGYDLEWCLAALEAENADVVRARTWLRNWAPSREESAKRT